MAEIWTMGELLVEIMRPEADRPLEREGWFRGPFPSGAPAIMIDTVARLGHSAGIIGGVGRDGFGKCLLERLSRDGVDVRNVLVSEQGSTGCAFVSYAGDGSRTFIFHIGNTPAAWAKAPEQAAFGGARYFHVMGCSLTADAGLASEILKAMEACLACGAKVSFDPNIRPELMRGKASLDAIWAVLSRASVFLPGREELLALTGEAQPDRAVAGLFTRLNALEVVAVKDGSKGCEIFTRTERFAQGVFPVAPVDATGAGDCFDGAFLCALLEGRPLREAARRASAAAALNTAAFGPMEGAISPEAVSGMLTAGEGHGITQSPARP